MHIQNICTITLIGITSGFYTPLRAQTSLNDFHSQELTSTNSNFIGDLERSIFALKIAEAAIRDSTIAAQLDKIGYLAIYQSSFSPIRKDKFLRAGYWLMPYPIAIKYGLTVNGTIDERLDLEKSTKVAFRYWSELVSTYTSDSLADLTFVESAIAMTKHKKDSTNSSLFRKRERLRKIKKTYVQSSAEKAVGPLEQVALVKSKKPISFESIHHFTQIPTSELETLNPKWVGNLYDPKFGKLKLPMKYVEKFKKGAVAMEQKTRDDEILFTAGNIKRLNQLKGDIPDLKNYKPIRYKVKMGDNLGRISQKYRVKISSIRSWNELKSDRIYAGQKLTIYVPNNQKAVADKPSSTKSPKGKLKTGEYSEYKVQTGDTLWDISQLFDDVNADMIMEDNGINENISPGQILKIRKVE